VLLVSALAVVAAPMLITPAIVAVAMASTAKRRLVFISPPIEGITAIFTAGRAVNDQH
jgi:hypothetical protein